MKKLAFNNNTNILGKDLEGAAQGKKYSNFLKKIKEKRLRNADQTIRRNPINFFMNFNVNVDLNEENQNEKISDEGKIWVEGVLMDKADIVNLANKVLKKVNYKKDKNLKSNFIPIGKGKMAITQGVTVEDFVEKYKVK